MHDTDLKQHYSSQDKHIPDKLKKQLEEKPPITKVQFKSSVFTTIPRNIALLMNLCRSEKKIQWNYDAETNTASFKPLRE